MIKKDLICIMCPMGCNITITDDDGKVTVTGNTCRRGEIYARTELTSPQRVVTSLCPLVGGGVVPCKTKGTVPKEKIFEVLDIIKKCPAASPVRTGDVLVENVCGTGVDVVATADR